MIFSDSHGKTQNMLRVLERRAGLPQLVIHLGDLARDADALGAAFPRLPLECVRGNNDYASSAPERLILPIKGHRVYVAHGHRHGVKGGRDAICAAARSQGCDIVLFGHTHMPLATYDDGLYLLNPGSISLPAAGRPTFGLLSVTPAGVSVNFAQV